jgi:hypothetical protein
MGESIDSFWVVPSFRGALLVRFVIVGTIVIIVPLIVLFLFHALSFSMPVFYPAVCISTADDVVQVTVVLTMPSATLLRWSVAIGRVPTGTLSMVKLVTPVSVLVIVDWIDYGCYVQHHLEVLNMCVDFFIILG